MSTQKHYKCRRMNNMKKFKWLSLFLVISFVFCLSGCTENPEALEQKITELKTQINELEIEKKNLEENVSSVKVDKGVAKYVVTLEIKQTHYTLDLEQHLKDKMNEITIQIPVDKEYYDSVSVGTVIDDSFRMGSMIMKGSFGKWKVTVKDKSIQ